MCVNGMFVALELKKTADEKPDLLQEHKIACINRAQGIGIKTYPENWEKVYRVLKILSTGGKYDRNEFTTT